MSVEVPRTLAQFNWIDFTGKYEIGLAALRKRIRTLDSQRLADLRQIEQALETHKEDTGAIEALPQIVIAALNGFARAGGAELALACDIRLAAAHATMAYPEAGWGSFPGAGAPYRLASIVGRGRALELICTSRVIDASEMERLGLVQGVYPADRLGETTRDLAERIAAAGPLATRGAKRIMGARLDPGLTAARELSDALRYAIEWSDDVDEGIAAQRDGRVPRFTGR